MKKQILNEEFLRMQRLAGVITESQYKEKVKEEEEENLSSEEQKIFDDIISTLNEGTFDSVLEKIKSYAKKGLMTAAILASLMASPNLSQAQKKDIKQITNTEMSASTTKKDMRGALNQALKSTNPYVINSKDFDSNIPFTSWNYGANAGKSNATVGLSLSMDKGSDVISISIAQVPGKSTAGYDAVVKAAESLGGKVTKSSISTDILISKDKISDVTNFVKTNINNLTK